MLPFVLFLSVFNCNQKQSPSSAEQQLRAQINNYFVSWSNADMQTYASIFHPEAYIAYVDREGEVHPFLLPDFIRSQENAHRSSPERMREEPIGLKLEMRGRVAFAVVQWKLYKGAVTKTGYDYFTFLQYRGEWKILNLTFEETPS